jgi:hypothetical protein
MRWRRMWKILKITAEMTFSKKQKADEKSGLTLEQIEKITSRILPIGIPEATPKELFKRGMQRTKMIRSDLYSESHQALIDSGVEIMAEWITMDDDEVCDDCREIAENGPYSIEKIITMMPACPECRCVALPVRIDKNKLKS